MMFLLGLLFTLAFAAEPALGVQRLIVISKESPSVLFDPGHAKTVSVGLYDSTTAAELDADGVEFFNDVCGIDATGAPYNATEGSWTISVGKIYQYQLGVEGTAPDYTFNYNFLEDSDHKSYKKDGKRKIVAAGLILLFSTSGNYGGPDYPEIGITPHFAPGQAIAYAHYNSVKPGEDWSKDKNVERFIIESPWTTIGRLNSENKFESDSKIKVIDEDDNVAYGVLTSTVATVFGVTPVGYTTGTIFFK